jgi:hypothetical protein
MPTYANEKSIGDDKQWDISTNGLIQVEIGS